MNSETVRLVKRLFLSIRMLFKHMAEQNGFVIYKQDASGRPLESFTSEFKLWCNRLNGLDEKSVLRGLQRIEQKIYLDSLNGVKTYPPNYMEFLAMATKTRTDNRHPCHKDFKALPAPKKYKNGKENLMRDLLKETGLKQ